MPMPLSTASPRRRVRLALLLSLAALAALSGGRVLAVPLPGDDHASPPGFIITTDYCAEEEEVAFLGLLNAYRSQSGLAPLAMSQTLGAAAESHSIDMATSGYFDHTMSDGTSVAQNIRNHGYAGSTYGENIAAGMETATSALSIWQNSASHNENMLRGAYKSVGIGRAHNPSSGYGWYWTTIFGGEIDVPATICGQAPPAIPLAPAPDPAQPSLLTGNANATVTDDLNLRAGPGPSYSVLSAVPNGSRLTVTGDPQSGYVPVNYGTWSGWVATEFVAFDPAAPAPAAPTGSVTALTTDALNLRSGPDQSASILQTIPAGSPVTLTGTATDGYLGVTFNGMTGWADAAYLTATETPPAAPAPAAPADPGPVSIPQSVGVTTATTTDDLNLRAGPSRDAPVLLVIPAGSPVQLTGEQSPGYFGVSYNGNTGWADAAYLT